MKKSAAKGSAVNSVVYPGVAAWLDRNNVTVCGLAKRMGYDYRMQAGVYKALAGKAMPNLRMVLKLLDATGMTFEEAFGGAERA